MREFKELLDAKDEQLDMLSRIHSFSPYSPPCSTSSGAPSARPGAVHSSPSMQSPAHSGSHDDHDDMFTVQDSEFLIQDHTGSFYLGGSSGMPFIEFFKMKLRDSGRLGQDFDVGAFFFNQQATDVKLKQIYTSKPPSRLFADQLVTSYFQEYHSLFPVLHRPTFLEQYNKLCSSSETGTSPTDVLPHYALAQLFLVLAITAQNSEAHDRGELRSYNAQWEHSLEAILLDNTLESVQCLVLAQLYCFSVGDFHRLMQYKALAVAKTLRLGLHRSQDFASQDVLSKELKKRAFWSVYCLDSFSAAQLGLPRLLKDEDILAEFPTDVDDEHIGEEGFTATPSDSANISSAIALFKCSRILANVLDSVYPVVLSQEQTFRRLKELEDELDSWKTDLPSHLRLEFANGVPAVTVVNSRSPLLILAYHYIRALIHRPVVRSVEGSKSSPSFLALTDACKHIVQIVQLLSERKLGFSFCLNKNQLLINAGFVILYGAVSYQQKGSLAKESGHMISVTIHELEKSGYAMVPTFRRLAESVVQVEQMVTGDLGTVSLKRLSQSPNAVPAHMVQQSVPPQGESFFRRRMSSVSAKITQQCKELSAGSMGALRRVNSQTMGGSFAYNNANSSDTTLVRRSTLLGPVTGSSQRPQTADRFADGHKAGQEGLYNGDYLDWTLNMSNQNQRPVRMKQSAPSSTDEWVQLLAVMDASTGAHIYGNGENTIASVSAPDIHGFPITTGSGWDNMDYPIPMDNGNINSNSQPDNASYVSPEQHAQGLHQVEDTFRANPPSVSSFSTLSDGGFSSEDSIGQKAGSCSPANLADMIPPSNGLVERALFDQEDLSGLLAAQAGFMTVGQNAKQDMSVWGM